LDINTQTYLAFELPGGLTAIKATQLVISGRVARCEEDESSKTYKIGFEFTDVMPEQVEILQALLERYHFRHKV
jgi:PilZ domain